MAGRAGVVWDDIQLPKGIICSVVRLNRTTVCSVRKKRELRAKDYGVACK